ncbi:MAG: hypothetical protein ACOH1T_08130 [Microbacteriaceae bacterium]
MPSETRLRSSRRARPSWRVSRSFATAITALLAGALVLSGATAANAVAMNVSIQSTNATTQTSGSDFTYQINFACLGTNAPSCTNATLTIPLTGDVDMTGWGFDVTGGPAGFIESWTVDAASASIIVVLGDMSAGVSQAISLRVTPPNLTTPSGTTWSLLPSITSPDSTMASTTAPVPATGVATATVPLSVSKSSPRSFYYEGTAVTYTVTATCPATKPNGSLFADSITLVDTLPAGLDFVSAGSGVWDSTARTITWQYSAAELPASCGGPAGNPALTSPVIATVGAVGSASSDDFASYAQVTNSVTATAIPRGGSTPSAPQTATRTIVVLDGTDDPRPGTHGISKNSAGPLRHAAAPAQPKGTYPGRWLPNGIAENAPASVTATNPASYTLSPSIQFEEFEYEIVDRMPCLEGAGNVYTESAGLCASPAFNPIAVRINYSGPANVAGYAPQYRDNRDGLLYDLTASTTGGNWASWIVPTTAIGFVAELVIPRDENQQLRRSDTIVVHGFADSATVEGDVLRNRGQISWFLRDAPAPYEAPQFSNLADIFILDGPQLGMAKSMANVGGVTGSQASVRLTATLMVPGTATNDVVITDLLPADVTVYTLPSQVTITPVGATAFTLSAPAITVEKIDNHAGTGRTLVRVTVPASELPIGSGRHSIAVQPFTINKPAEPGTWTNSAQVFFDNASLLDQCANGDYRSDDANGVRPAGAASVINCEASATFVTATSAEGQFALRKTVQGDYDSIPAEFPAVGHVTLEDGTADYEIAWTNTGAPALTGAVLYDVFPHVGDRGVSGGQATETRDSEFRPRLASVDAAPAGVTISYSASSNPCRAEVYPTQSAGCDSDWTTDPADLGGLSEVMAIRLVSSANYLTGEGISVGFRMSVPSVDRDQIAWNSVAAFARTTSGVALLPSEAPKVGITASDRRFALEKTVDVSDAKPGDLLTYTLSVTNAGTGTSVPTTVTDVLPAGLDFVSVDAPGTWAPSTRTVSWPIPALDSGVTHTLDVRARVGAKQTSTSLVNEARIVLPPDYSPTIITEACVGDADAACALTSVPVPDPDLVVTGTDAAPAALAATAAALLGLGIMFVARRRTARLS